jgi:hypothetical protein
MSRLIRTLAVALVALCVVASGSALAASNSGHSGPTASAAKKHRKHHRKKKRRVSNGTNGSTGSNGSNGSTGAKGATGPQGLQGPQGPKGDKGDKGDTGPSDGFASTDLGNTSIGTGPDDTIVAQLSPGNGNYIVTATVELGNNAASANSVSCKLLQGFQIIGAGTEDLTPLATYSRTMTLTGAATGGALKVACQATNPAQARNRVMTAVQVGTLHA